MIKKIIIVRHAKSSWTDFTLADFDRPLDARGIKDGPFMAELLMRIGHYPQKLISSAATRAKSTASYFSAVFKIPLETTKDLYHGEPQDYMDQLHVLDESMHCVAMFGHNPGITYLANLIKPNVIDDIPTCGMIIVEMPQDILWSKMTWSDMKLIDILTPKNPNP